MEYLMKGIIVAMFMVVLILQTEGDFAIHLGRKTWWHLWKGLSLFVIGLTPIALWLFMDVTVILSDYIFLLITYLIYRWLFFDILMNDKLDQPIDFIGTTAFYAKLLHRWFPRQAPQGYLWIRVVAFFAWNVVWWFRWLPGDGILPFSSGL
jgi:hypothetical protein